jgi:tetratricopeptide (TPR) repeat protein
MPLDAYSLCPGGTGKRLKFCCKDMLPELQHVERMLEGEQYHACVQRIEQLEEKFPQRACLWAIKSQLQRVLGQIDELKTTVQQFVAKYPDNIIALSEQAMIVAVEEDSRKGVDILQEALARCGEEIPARLYEALGVVAQVLLSDGHILAARALLLMQTAVHRDDTRPLEMVVQLNGTAQIPLLIRDDPLLEKCPDGVPWKEAFEEAMAPVSRGMWAPAAQRLAALSARTGDAPAVWRNLATLRAWLADTQGAVEALNKYASISVPMEDAVEARALALLMSEDALGDGYDLFGLEYEVSDVEALQVALSSSARVVASAVPPNEAEEEEGPPPKAAFLLLDRPAVRGGTVAVDQVPRIIGQALLYGRQTDRAARLVLPQVGAPHIPAVQAILAEAPAGAIAAEPVREVLGKTSATRELIRPNWHVPRDTPQETILQLVNDLFRDVCLVRWPQTPLGLLDGKSPKEAAANPAYRIKLLAAILVLQQWLDQSGGHFDLNELRTQLGLGVLGPISPEQVNVDRLPLVRLARVEVDKLSDKSLVGAFRRVVAFRVPGAVEKYATVVADRPSLAGTDDQLTAFRVMVRSSPDAGQALAYLERGRQAAEKAGQSSATWDLLELSLRLERGEVDEMRRLMEHLQRDHIREQGVAQALTQFLMQIGAIRPDGQPAAPPPAAEPSIVVPGGAAGAPGKLWTPDNPGGGSGGGSGKLWTPD